MRFRLYGLAFMMCIGSLLLSGCSQDVGALDARDSASAIMKRARTKTGEGDLDGAIKLYSKVLNDNARLARAHLDVALLLGEQDKYLDSICHYKRYLDMRPDTEKRRMIEKRMQRAIQLFIATQTPDSSLRTGRKGKKKGERVVNNDFATTLQKLHRAESNEKSLRATIVELKRDNKKLTGKLSGCESELDQYRAIVGLSQGEPEKPPVDIEPEPEEVKPDVPRTYRVRRGDTLSSIASDVYGDEKQWVKIQLENKNILRGSQNIKPGQVLVIP